MQEARYAIDADEVDAELERHRAALTGYCYRMLGSPFEADDAVQETLLRAWRGYEQFQGRASITSWLYRIATNVCLDILKGRARRATPMDLGPARPPLESNLHVLPEVTWIQPIPSSRLIEESDPADVVIAHETIRLAFVAALQHLSPRQRAVLILREVMRQTAAEVAFILDTTVPSVNSALQRARAAIAAAGLDADAMVAPVDPSKHGLLARYVRAFEAYDLEELTALIREDARQSMPPFDLWLSGRNDVLAWWFGPGDICRGSRLVPTVAANDTVAFGQYKPSATGSGFEPWALQVLEWNRDKVAEFTFFLDTERLFPLFGLPLQLD
ncbi:MAG TPA: sigma-70 family RNA polymerase sigma factor [Candidatus Dormibacteraeota bacterium]